VAEAERAMPVMVRQIAEAAGQLGLGEEAISVRMTGCPNGCTRPYLGDVGLVGTTLGKYDLHLGGDGAGTRLNELYLRNVPLEAIPVRLGEVLRLFATGRRPAERFGDFCHRVGVARLRERVGPDEPVPVALTGS